MTEAVTVEIRVAQPSDAAAMEQLRYENLIYRANNGQLSITDNERDNIRILPENTALLRQLLARANEEDYYLVAYLANKLVGFCRMTWRPTTQQFQFRRFYVDIALRGRSIGSQIMRVALERAQQSPLKPQNIFLMTGDYNTAAQAIYKHWGFVQVEATAADIEDDAFIKMVLAF